MTSSRLLVPARCALPLLVTLAAACQATPRMFTSSGTGGSETGGGPASSGSTTSTGGGPSTTASTGGSTSTGTGGGSTGGGGTGGSVPNTCMPGQAPYAGPLCGPPNEPCTVHVDEVLNNPPSFRNDAPTIAVDGHCSPRVAFSVAVNGFHGFWATRDMGTWTVTPAPFNAATVGLVIPPGGTPMLMADDGAFGVTLWRLSGTQWTMVDQVPGMRDFWASGIGHDDQGVIHATVMDNNDFVSHGKHTTTWAMDMLSDTTSGPIPLAVSTTGAAQFSYWTSTGGNGWVLKWAVAPSTTEAVAPLGSSAITVSPHAIAVTPPDTANPDGRPHLLYSRLVAGTTAIEEVAYATRNGPGAWTTLTIDQPSPNGTMCTGQPSGPGATCNYAYDQLHPVAAVASRGGDVRLFYQKSHHQGTMVAQCQGFPVMMCFWVPQSDTSTGQVMVAWVNAGATVGKAVVIDKIMTTGSTAVVDTIGHVHLAAYDGYPPSQNGTSVRVVEIGP